MTPDAQPTAPAGLHPETAVICAGRPGHTAGEPLNHPIVLASNFQAGATAAPGSGEDSRACCVPAGPGRRSPGRCRPLRHAPPDLIASCRALYCTTERKENP